MKAGDITSGSWAGEVLHSTSLNRVNPFERAPLSIRGINENVPNTTKASIWEGPTVIRPLPSAAISMTIGSTAGGGGTPTDDTDGGSGAEFVKVDALALDGSEFSHVIPMEGTTRVPIPTPIWRIQPSTGVVDPGGAAGGQRTNHGIITIEGTGDDLGTVFEIIGLDADSEGYGATRSGAFTVPQGFVAFAKAAFWGTDDNMRTYYRLDIPGVGQRTTMAILQDHGQVIIRGCLPALTDFSTLARSVSGANARMTTAVGVFPITSRSGKCPP